jgi:hypothetical protein
MLASAIIFFSGVFLATTTFLYDLGVDTCQVNNHNAIQPSIERHYDQDDQVSLEEIFIQAASSKSGCRVITEVKRIFGMIQGEEQVNK